MADQRQNTPKWMTQVTDTFIDNHQHLPVQHPSEAAARNYMQDIFARRRCDVVLLNPQGIQMASLRDGERDSYEQKAA